MRKLQSLLHLDSPWTSGVVGEGHGRRTNLLLLRVVEVAEGRELSDPREMEKGKRTGRVDEPIVFHLEGDRRLLIVVFLDQ